MKPAVGPVVIPRGVTAALAARVRHGAPRVQLRFGRAPGDAMLCTAVLHELRRRGQDRLWMESNLAQLFQRSPDVDVVIPRGHRARQLLKLTGGRPVFPSYDPHDDVTDTSVGPDRHIITCMCRHVLSGPISLRPYLYLGEEEKGAAAFAAGTIVLQSYALSSNHPIGNKNWGVERVQEVARLLAPRHRLIQIGAAEDPPLTGVEDRRGVALRDSAAILARAECFVGMVGFGMHLARAVECRSVIVFGGREAPWQSGYIANENLTSEVSCAPCWQWNRCDHERKCLSEILPVDVVAAVGRQLERTGQPLPVETDDLD
jgi:ADP-heptose:LPS heptosyltransferase